MSRFNLPGLYFVKRGNLTHITRTNITGGLTECGITLKKGWLLTRQEPDGGLCRACSQAIINPVFAKELHA